MLSSDLAKLLNRTKCPLAPVQVRDVVAQLAEALACESKSRVPLKRWMLNQESVTHATGIVHADVKTENVLLVCDKYHILDLAVRH